MPTPSDEPVLTNPIHALLRSVHTTCPPEVERHTASDLDSHDDGDISLPDAPNEASIEPQSPSASAGAASPGSTETHEVSSPSPRSQDNDESITEPSEDSPIPMSVVEDPKQSLLQNGEQVTSPSIASIPPPLPSPDTYRSKTPPKHTLSYLRHGSKFVGTQQSDRQVYNVEVEIKHVDMAESFVCGYLRIEGLTQDHPTLTTYFEGEIIGTKYTFLTSHAEWGSNEKVDMQHWNRFAAWRPFKNAARRSDFTLKNYADKENIFMRWKEYFLVPDHRVRTISGASFEGFYYICFNQVTGHVSGIYFHSKSEKYQQLELKHIDDRGCMGAMELR